MPRLLAEKLFSQRQLIEEWFQTHWKTVQFLTLSVDLRYAGWKLVPVDTNLFAAGFNNLAKNSLSHCTEAVQKFVKENCPQCKTVLILPESHSRNLYYFQNLANLQAIFIAAGFDVLLGSLDETHTASQQVDVDTTLGFTQEPTTRLSIEPITRDEKGIHVNGIYPDLILLNNDLSGGIPRLLQDLNNQYTTPSPQMGWWLRRKSSHFSYYNEVAKSFAAAVQLDDWLINPYFSTVAGIDFILRVGFEQLAFAAEQVLNKIRLKYQEYGIKDEPFLVIKSDHGTYGMNVMMVHDAQQLLRINRKDRTRMAKSKGGQTVTSVLIQEGVPTCDRLADGAVAEPVMYLMGQDVVGGFYRSHHSRGITANLNAPGMQFHPIDRQHALQTPRGYSDGVIARLAAMAAEKEYAAQE